MMPTIATRYETVAYYLDENGEPQENQQKVAKISYLFSFPLIWDFYFSLALQCRTCTYSTKS